MRPPSSRGRPTTSTGRPGLVTPAVHLSVTRVATHTRAAPTAPTQTATAVGASSPTVESAKNVASHGMRITPRKATTISATIPSRTAFSGRADCRSTAVATMNRQVVAAACDASSADSCDAAAFSSSVLLMVYVVSADAAQITPDGTANEQHAPEEARPEPLGVGHEREEERRGCRWSARR